MNKTKNIVTKSIQGFLRDAEELLTESKDKDLGVNPIFSKDVQMLDGFTVGFMNPKLFARLCKKYGLKAGKSEAILMQTSLRTDPHVHMKGNSTFLPLGKKQGYPSSKGGTYLGAYRKGQEKFMLRYVPAREGKSFRVPAGKIHFFAPAEGARFSAIAFVSPRIKQKSGFDMKHFTAPAVSVSGARATVCTT